MKNLTWYLMAILAGVTTMASDRALAGDPLPGTGYQEWRFDSAANPAPPEANNRPLPGAQASVAPGKFGMGWQAQRAGLGDKTGYWDLGRSGVITLTLGNPTPSSSVRQISVQVWQWIDMFIFSDSVSVSFPGSTRVATTQAEETSGAVGGWVVNQTVWEVEPGTIADTITITGPADGAVIDQVVVTTVSVVPEPLLLTIKPLPGETNRVEVSWPAEAGMVPLEWSANLNDPQGWSPLQVQPQLNGDRFTVTTEISDTFRFFRVKQ